MKVDRPAVRIIGAGPTGALLAILLQRRGHAVELYETRPDPRGRPPESGRSINLALADRGIHALQLAGVFRDLEQALLPMRGRLIHDAEGGTSLQPYGQRPNELIYSISRHRLNQTLLEVAARQPGVTVHFEHRFESAEFDEGTALIRDLRHGRLISVPMHPMLATDGAGSWMRRSMKSAHLIDAHETDLEHGYKELSIPADAAGRHRMARDALHIWPRGNFMLIALPNEDGSFTATLFLAKHGEVSFESLTEPAAIERFLSQNFPDARELMPNRIAEFNDHPVGFLGTVSASPWHHQGMTALIGDSAHAIVPFHGQGMNCCFEDCVEFDACTLEHASWEKVFAGFGALRKPNTDAIAVMALDNYLEMRERVAHPKFQLQQALSLELERRFPQRFIPRYSMVMFHHEIPYQTALQRGTVQAELLADLTAGAASTLSDIDFERAEREIRARLTPLN
ncbi:MAG TPA: NAD(P)/FAD-dependent oxidoreductase [Steroidobacteraceae bacterium]|nr:NAD(P)/FAD-dependent oxidoreductase [Steroidobacteraceae bacterium]